mgnify:CR=1 FL=1
MEGFTYQDQIFASQKDKIRFIADKYGLWHQLGKLSEECNELSIECVKSVNEGMVRRDIIQEIADVEILIEEIIHLTKLDRALIDGYKTYKINRQLMRIQKEENNVQMS